MTNPTVDIATTESASIVAGDTLKWKRTDLSQDYPNSAWVLSYQLRPEAGGAAITFNASNDGADYLVSVAAATTATWAPGVYYWAAYATKGATSERVRVDAGTLRILPNLAASQAENRTHAKIVLDAIEAVIQGRATKDQNSYAIAGRSLDRTPIPDLILLRDRYKAEYARELKAERIANGMGGGGQVLVRFGRG